MSRKTKTTRAVSLALAVAVRLDGVVAVGALECLLGQLIHANVAFQGHQTIFVVAQVDDVVGSVAEYVVVEFVVVAASASDDPPVRAHTW